MPDAPPHDITAEMGTLGSMLLNVEAAHYARANLEKECFYRLNHQEIFDALCAQLADKGTVDTVLLRDELKSRGTLEKVGGMAYIAECMESVPSSANVEYYAAIVREKHARRELISTAGEISKKAGTDSEDIEELAAEVRGAVDKVENAVTEQEADATELIEQLEDKYSQAREPGNRIGVATGCKWLDRKLSDNGIPPGHVCIVAGRPSSGKTAFAVNVACHAACENGRRVAFYSSEQRKQEVIERCLLHMSGLSRGRLKSGLSGEERRQWKAARQTLEGAPIYVTQSKAQDVDDIIADCRRQNGRENVDLAVVDYIQRLEAAALGGQKRNQEVAYMSRRIIKMAQDLDCGVLLLSQLNRESGRQTVREPTLTDLRGSGALEQDADTVVSISRKDILGMQAKDITPERDADVGRVISVLKQRQGPTGRNTHAGLNRPTLSFWNYSLEVENESEEGRNASMSEGNESDRQSKQAQGNHDRGTQGERGRAQGKDSESVSSGQKADGATNGRQQMLGGGELTDDESEFREGFDVEDDEIPF